MRRWIYRTIRETGSPDPGDPDGHHWLSELILAAVFVALMIGAIFICGNLG